MPWMIIPSSNEHSSKMVTQMLYW